MPHITMLLKCWSTNLLRLWKDPEAAGTVADEEKKKSSVSITLMNSLLECLMFIIFKEFAFFSFLRNAIPSISGPAD